MKVLLRNGPPRVTKYASRHNFLLKTFSMTHTESNTTFINKHVVFILWVYDNTYEFKITTSYSVRLRSLVDR
jgi:hypothetical protein